MQDDRQPPVNLDAEEAVLGSCLIDNEAFKKIADLKASDFYRDKNQWVWAAIAAVSKKGAAINQITVAHELAKADRLEDCGGSAYLSNLIMNVPTSVHVEYYAGIVRETAKSRGLIKLAGRIGDMGYEKNPDEAVAESIKLLQGYGTKTRKMREIEWFDANEDNFIKMRLPFDLHHKVKLFPGVVVIAGEKGQGKSAWLMDCIFRNLSEKRPQYFFVNDAQDVELKERFLGLSEYYDCALPTPDNLKVYERYDRFGDVIVEGGINYVDYLDVNSEFFSIGQEIDDIHRATGSGVTFIALQKNPKEALGVGGIYSWKRSQLYITLSTPELLDDRAWQGQLLLKKTRGRANKAVDPTGYSQLYDIKEGCKFRIKV